jgi:hypothetical protein
VNDKVKILGREYYHATKIQQMGMHVGKETCIDFFGGETDGKRRQGRRWCKRDNNIEMDLKSNEMAYGVDSTGLI